MTVAPVGIYWATRYFWDARRLEALTAGVCSAVTLTALLTFEELTRKEAVHTKPPEDQPIAPQPRRRSHSAPPRLSSPKEGVTPGGPDEGDGIEEAHRLSLLEAPEQLGRCFERLLQKNSLYRKEVNRFVESLDSLIEELSDVQEHKAIRDELVSLQTVVRQLRAVEEWKREQGLKINQLQNTSTQLLREGEELHTAALLLEASPDKIARYQESADLLWADLKALLQERDLSQSHLNQLESVQRILDQMPNASTIQELLNTTQAEAVRADLNRRLVEAEQLFFQILAMDLDSDPVDASDDGHCLLHAVNLARRTQADVDASKSLRQEIAKAMRSELRGKENSDLKRYLREEIQSIIQSAYHGSRSGFPRSFCTYLETRHPEEYCASSRARTDYLHLVRATKWSEESVLFCGEVELRVLAERVLKRDIILHRMEMQDDESMKDVSRELKGPEESELSALHLYHWTSRNHFSAFVPKQDGLQPHHKTGCPIS